MSKVETFVSEEATLRSPCLRAPEGHWYVRGSRQGRGPRGDQTPLQQNVQPVTVFCLHPAFLPPPARRDNTGQCPTSHSTPQQYKRQPNLVIFPEMTLIVRSGEMLSWRGKLTALPATRLCGAKGVSEKGPRGKVESSQKTQSCGIQEGHLPTLSDVRILCHTCLPAGRCPLTLRPQRVKRVGHVCTCLLSKHSRG